MVIRPPLIINILTWIRGFLVKIAIFYIIGLSFVSQFPKETGYRETLITGGPSSRNINMTFCKSLYGNITTVQNSSKQGENDKIDLPFVVVCITCVFMAFGGVSQ